MCMAYGVQRTGCALVHGQSFLVRLGKFPLSLLHSQHSLEDLLLRASETDTGVQTSFSGWGRNDTHTT
jgi:hypothetical protein